MSKHTSGLKLVADGETIKIRDADGALVATLHWLRGRNGLGGRRSVREVLATGRLFAAAPQLLDALKSVVDEMGSSITDLDPPSIRAAVELIAEVEGEGEG